MKKVVIFGGHDHDTWEKLGAKGTRTNLEKDGVYEEYDTNILLAAGAVKILRSVPGLTVYFPQEHGRNMSLKERVAYANAVGADFMIDIHSNASASRTATGAAAFYWKGSVNGKRAADIYAGLLKKAGFPLWSNGTYASNNEDGWSGFYMLKYSNMPGLLLENFFFTTRSDLENYLLNPSVQRVLMEIIANTVLRYFGMADNDKGVKVSSPVRDYYMVGDKLAGVSELQSKLNKVGFKLSVDGVFGTVTESAVKSFQRVNGLTVDGVAGKATLAKLDTIIANIDKNPVGPKPKEVEELELSKRQREELSATFKKARERGVFSSAEHEKAILDDSMTQSQLLYLTALIAGASLIGGERIK